MAAFLRKPATHLNVHLNVQLKDGTSIPTHLVILAKG